MGGLVQRLALWDTGGREEQGGSRLLPCTEASVGLQLLSCEAVDVILVCFSLANDTSAQNVRYMDNLNVAAAVVVVVKENY